MKAYLFMTSALCLCLGASEILWSNPCPNDLCKAPRALLSLAGASERSVPIDNYSCLFLSMHASDAFYGSLTINSLTFKVFDYFKLDYHG